MTLDAQHLRDHLQFLTGLAEHFETHATTDRGELSRQVYECAFRSNVLSDAFGDDMRAAWFIPLRFHLETCEITWTGAVLFLHLSGHGRPSSFRRNIWPQRSTKSSKHKTYLCFCASCGKFILPRLSISPTLKNLR